MTPAAFTVRTISRYNRLSNRLHKTHRDFDPAEKSAARILSSDPYNRTRQYHIKKVGRRSARRRAVPAISRTLAFPL